MKTSSNQKFLLIPSIRITFLSTPVAAEEDPSRVTLEPIITTSGSYAVGRYELANGSFVQLSSGCSEWAGGGAAVLLHPGGESGEWRTTTFASGPFLETDDYLIVESHVQVGSDGGEDWTAPEGCEHTIYDSTGTIYCTQVVAIEFATGTVRSAGWDTFTPITTGDDRFVLVSVAGDEQTPHRNVYGRPAQQLLVWDLETGHTAELGTTNRRLRARVADTEVFVRIGESPDFEYTAVNGTTGAVRMVTREEAAIPERTYRGRRNGQPRPTALTSNLDGPWQTTDGRQVTVQRSPGTFVQPLTGDCGLGGHQTDGLLFVDDGIYLWPLDLELVGPSDVADEP